jgi:hypothetical protein
MWESVVARLEAANQAWKVTRLGQKFGRMGAAQRPEEDIASRSCAEAVLGPMEVPGNRELKSQLIAGLERNR